MRQIVAYTMVMIGTAGAGAVVLLLQQADLPTGSAAAIPDADVRVAFVRTVALMFVAGILGGCLYNFRGLVKHTQEEDFKSSYQLSYYLRPISGGLSGIIVFFLLLGGAMTLDVGRSSGGVTWGTLLGRMPYIAFALLAGYSSHEFTLKMKDLAESLFAQRKRKEEPQ